jgi:opacity protein-like surface antigen
MFRILAGVASVAMIASAAAAQVCQGDLSFRGRPTHIAGSLAVSDNTTNFGGGALFGHAQGLYGGGSLGLTSFNGASGSAIVLGGAIGYSMPLANRSAWQLCPGGTLSLGFGPSQDVPGVGTMHNSEQTVTLGASVGRALPLNRDVTLLPFGSAAIGHTSIHSSLAGNSGSASDSYLLLGFGAGIQFSPNLVLRPALTVAAGADLIDDTVFSFGVSFALPR